MKKLDGLLFTKMIMNGADNLSNQAEMIDALNVFPVPDGDTGTNMNLSMSSGLKQLEANDSEKIGIVAGTFAKGLLMGARGNSGVILSQLFRGFSKSLEGKTTVDTKDFAKALDDGVSTAYKAVMKPVEGTILTVAKDAAKHAHQAARKSDDFTKVISDVVEAAKTSLRHTPELLPVLKEVGVVDSGGQGLLTIYEGFLGTLTGKELPKKTAAGPSMDELVHAEHHKVQAYMKTEDIHYGYCTEFMVKFEKDKLKNNPFNEGDFREELGKHGDSLLAVSDDELVKVHIHTESPGDMLTHAQRYGELINIKIDNMRQQHTNILSGPKSAQPAQKNVEQKTKKEHAIITVAMGDGIKRLFESLGAEVVIQGGQTMNPSTEDIVSAITEANADNVYILPNNSNIVMAAKQAADVAEEHVVVIPSKTIPQGISALLAFNPGADAKANESQMTESLKNVKSGQVTFAVRDTTIDEIDIKKDDFMGIADGEIVVSDKEKATTAQKLLDQMIGDDDEIVTIIWGENATEEEAGQLLSYIEERYDDVEGEVHEGGQPVYSYLIAVE
jgi:DAK2 domain fusion protein YloV